MASWTNLPPFRVLTATSVTRMDQLLDNITMLASHSHTGSGGDGASALSVWANATCPCETAPQHEFQIIPFLPDANTNWNRIVTCPVYPNGAAIRTVAGVIASGACISWSMILPGQATGGSWVVGLGLVYASNTGCIAACLGGSQLRGITATTSLINTYSATGTSTINGTFRTSCAIASGLYTLKLQVAGQDPSSSGFHAILTHIGMTYT